jgi:hypothetical protein
MVRLTRTKEATHTSQSHDLHLVLLVTLLVSSERRPASYRRLARDECSCILDIKTFLFGSSRIFALPSIALASGFDAAHRVVGGRWLVGMSATADPWLQVPEQVSQEAFGANDEARKKGILQGKGINKGGIPNEHGQVRLGSVEAVAVGGPGLDGLQGTTLHVTSRAFGM